MKKLNNKEQELKKIVEDLDIELIHLQFTDVFGVMKNVSITVEQLDKALEGKITFDGSSIDGFVRIEESDMYLMPDVDTFTVFPWTSTAREARLICDVYNIDGTPFHGCPRNMLKEALKDAEAMGYTMNVGPECEFFLFQTDEKGLPTLETHDEAGYFDLSPVDLGGAARKEISSTLTKMGFHIEASHHEVAHGQHEIDFKYEDALKTADNVMTFKMVVRIIAQRHGLHATFMPKPKYGINGSGMHLNLSLAHTDGKNAFYDPKTEDKLSQTAYYFITGLIENAKGLAAITNPTVNSYKRLVPGYEAPIMIAWSMSNRSPLVRIPSSRGESTRVELRNPDPSANPYLALAGVLQIGLDGVKNEKQPPAPITDNIYHYTEAQLKEANIDALPANLYEAIIALDENKLVQDAIGRHSYLKIREASLYEWSEYSQYVSQWEVERYLRKF